jgi:hypothetical protein
VNEVSCHAPCHNIGQDDAGLLETLVHELHHLVVDPVHPRFANSAEARVHVATAATLVAVGAGAR